MSIKYLSGALIAAVATLTLGNAHAENVCQDDASKACLKEAMKVAIKICTSEPAPDGENSDGTEDLEECIDSAFVKESGIRCNDNLPVKCGDWVATDCVDEVFGNCLYNQNDPTSMDLGFFMSSFVSQANNECKSVCSNTKCEFGETNGTCPIDCMPVFEDGICDGLGRENEGAAFECGKDCPWGCGDGVVWPEETNINCPEDVLPAPMDGHCDEYGREDEFGEMPCEADCLWNCGNETCTSIEYGRCEKDCFGCGDKYCSEDEKYLTTTVIGPGGRRFTTPIYIPSCQEDCSQQLPVLTTPKTQAATFHYKDWAIQRQSVATTVNQDQSYILIPIKKDADVSQVDFMTQTQLSEKVYTVKPSSLTPDLQDRVLKDRKLLLK